jgi:hypothetical protein
VTHVTAVIASHARIESLQQAILSLLENGYANLSVLIIADGNEKLLETVAKMDVGLLFNLYRRDYVFSMNRAMPFVSDAALYASDDLCFPKGFIKQAVNRLENEFPDKLGLIGFNTLSTPKNTPFAFGLMGKAFINQFPNYQVFCPDYIHYGSDTEMGMFAQKIERFHFMEDISVEHHRDKDLTYKLANKVRERDRRVYLARSQRGLLWGRDFGRLEK